jgi:hypothetical protein
MNKPTSYEDSLVLSHIATLHIKRVLRLTQLGLDEPLRPNYEQVANDFVRAMEDNMETDKEIYEYFRRGLEGGETE